MVPYLKEVQEDLLGFGQFQQCQIWTQDQRKFSVSRFRFEIGVFIGPLGKFFKFWPDRSRQVVKLYTSPLLKELVGVAGNLAVGCWSSKICREKNNDVFYGLSLELSTQCTIKHTYHHLPLHTGLPKQIRQCSLPPNFIANKFSFLGPNLGTQLLASTASKQA